MGACPSRLPPRSTRGPRGARVQPGPGDLRGDRHHARGHQADGGGVLRQRRRRPDARPARPADRPGAVDLRRPGRDAAGHRAAGPRTPTRSTRSGCRRALPTTSRPSRSPSPPAAPPTRSARPRSRSRSGARTWAPWSSIPGRYVVPTSTTPTSCASTSTRSRARRSPTRSGSPGWPASCSRSSASSATRRRPATGACTSSCGSSRSGSSPTCGTPRSGSAASWPAATTASPMSWWKEERGERIFVDFNQNNRDRTIASAYSLRPLPGAPVSTPMTWDELAGVTDPRGVQPVHGPRPDAGRRPVGERSTTRRTPSSRCSTLWEELPGGETELPAGLPQDARRAAAGAAEQEGRRALGRRRQPHRGVTPLRRDTRPSRRQVRPPRPRRGTACKSRRPVPPSGPKPSARNGSSRPTDGTPPGHLRSPHVPHSVDQCVAIGAPAPPGPPAPAMLPADIQNTRAAISTTQPHAIHRTARVRQRVRFSPVLLAFDTATPLVTVALHDGDDVVVELRRRPGDEARRAARPADRRAP